MGSSRTKIHTTRAASSADTKQNAPSAQNPEPSINRPPTAAPTTMLALVTDADTASSVPRASGTCSVSKVVFDANRAPITADSRRLRTAVAGSGPEIGLEQQKGAREEDAARDDRLVANPCAEPSTELTPEENPKPLGQCEDRGHTLRQPEHVLEEHNDVCGPSEPVEGPEEARPDGTER